MKKNHLVLVLLVTWSLLSIPFLSSDAEAGGFPNGLPRDEGAQSQDLIVGVNDASDDDSGGDPGDAGDGYGIAPPPRSIMEGEMNGQFDSSAIDELMLILRSLIQLAL